MFPGSHHRVPQRHVDLARPVDGRQRPDQGLAVVAGHQAEAEHEASRQRRQGRRRQQRLSGENFRPIVQSK